MPTTKIKLVVLQENYDNKNNYFNQPNLLLITNYYYYYNYCITTFINNTLISIESPFKSNLIIIVLLISIILAYN